MTKVTYLGDEPTTWAGVRFEPGKPVDVTNPHILKKAPGNPFFQVEGKPAVDPVEGLDLDALEKRGPGRPRRA